MGLTALVKFGADDAKLIETTCMEGQFELDENRGTIESLNLDTVSGCAAIKVGGGGGVTLNDTEFHVASRPSAGAAPPAAPSSKDETPAQQPEKKRGSLGVALGEGAVIMAVMPNSGAEKAGLKPGDTIVRLADRPVKEREDFAAVLANKAAGDKVRVTFLRDGKEQTVEVTLGQATQQQMLPPGLQAMLAQQQQQQQPASPGNVEAAAAETRDGAASPATKPTLTLEQRMKKYRELMQELPNVVSDYTKMVELLKEAAELVGDSGFDHGNASYNLACAGQHAPEGRRARGAEPCGRTGLLRRRAHEE